MQNRGRHLRSFSNASIFWADVLSDEAKESRKASSHRQQMTNIRRIRRTERRRNFAKHWKIQYKRRHFPHFLLSWEPREVHTWHGRSFPHIVNYLACIFAKKSSSRIQWYPDSRSWHTSNTYFWSFIAPTKIAALPNTAINFDCTKLSSSIFHTQRWKIDRPARWTEIRTWIFHLSDNCLRMKHCSSCG